MTTAATEFGEPAPADFSGRSVAGNQGLLYAEPGPMNRNRIAFAALAAWLSGCGPDDKPQQACASKPDFLLTVRLGEGLLPDDTLISLTFGGDGHESYQPNAHNERQVLFCEATRTSADGGAGAGGATSSENHAFAGSGGTGQNTPSIRTISCELWTGGPASVSVHAGEWHVQQALTPKANLCTVWNDISLGPDPEP